MQHNQHISDLGPLLERLGVRHVVIAPGSRNAPLIQLFTSGPAFKCYSIVDERSAGYVALGMARQLLEPVVVVTTSGTAVLNLSPAVAEAFHQQVPLIVLTADRPLEYMSQFNNQVTDQVAPFFNHSLGFYEFSAEVRTRTEIELELQAVEKLISAASGEKAGPVHLNIPLTEPLYEKLPEPVLTDAKPLDIPVLSGDLPLTPVTLPADKKIMLLAGMGNYNAEIRTILSSLTYTEQIVVVAENIANMPSDRFIANPELILGGATKDELKNLAPEIVIGFGGQVVSKRLKLFIQSQEQLETFEPEGGSLAIVRMLAGITVEKKILSEKIISSEKKKEDLNEYLSVWKTIEARESDRASGFLDSAPYGNFTAIHEILTSVPSQAAVHLGNSATIRYSQLLPLREDLTYFSNRGVSGIDGSVSAAVGAAMVSDKFHLLLLGDLSFVYDSSGLWNKGFPGNLRIIVLNDGGGGIFRLLDGPERMDFFEEFSVTHHPVSLELISQAYGRSFQRACNMEDLGVKMTQLFHPGSTLSVLEVDTVGSENSRIFKQFFNRNQ